MTKEGTIRLLAAIYRRALQEREYLGESAMYYLDVEFPAIKEVLRENCCESSMYHLNVELPAIKEALNESFKEL